MGAKANMLIYLEKNNLKKSDFYLKTGLSNGFLDKSENISSQNLAIIISEYSDLSLEWLVTGRGQMLKENSPQKSDQDETICFACKAKDQQIIRLQERLIEFQDRFIDGDDKKSRNAG